MIVRYKLLEILDYRTTRVMGLGYGTETFLVPWELVRSSPGTILTYITYIFKQYFVIPQLCQSLLEVIVLNL